LDAVVIDITLIVLDALSPKKNPANIRIHLIFLEIRIIGLHFAADSMGLSSLKFFSGRSVKLSYFCKSRVSAVQGHPKSLIWYHTKARMRLPISPS